MKKFLPYIIAGVILIGGGVAYFVLRGSDTTKTTDSSQNKPIENSESGAEVPEPTEEDVIRNFFQLIDEGKASDAVLAMSVRNTGDDASKQAWGVQFNAITSVKVAGIEASMPDDWTSTKHTYRVALDMTMDPSSASAAIPYYGYVEGQNTRFIPIVKEGGLWKVDGIATGP